MQETMIIGNTEYTAVRLNAFEANRLLLRLNKVVMPVVGGLTKGKQAQGVNLMDMDLSDATTMIAEHLTEDVMDSIVFPMFAGSKVYSVEKKMFIKDAAGMNIAFSSDNLFDFYELVWEVLRYNFAPFFGQIAKRFGDRFAHAKAAPKASANSPKS